MLREHETHPRETFTLRRYAYYDQTQCSHGDVYNEGPGGVGALMGVTIAAGG